MNITIVGAGNMGTALARQFAAAGHRVRITARHLDKAQAVAAGIAGVVALPAEQAVGDSSVVIVATGYADAIPALRSLGSMAGRVVVDITNPLTADYMGLTVGFSSSAAEELAKALPGAEVVKAFNTLFAPVLAAGPTLANGDVATVFYAGDSERAKRTIRALIESIGFEPVDAGSLRNARYLEPLAGLNIYLGYGAGLGTGIAPTWAGRA